MIRGGSAPPNIPTVSPLLTPIVSRNLLLLQSLPDDTPYRPTKVRRRQDEHRLGTAARRIIERLSRLPRRLQSDGGASGRVRCALSTGAGGRDRPQPHAPLPPGTVVPFAPQECRENCDVGRCRTTGPARLHWHRLMGSSPVGDSVGRTSGRSVRGTRWHHRLGSEQLPQARHAFRGGEAPVVWPPRQG